MLIVVLDHETSGLPQPETGARPATPNSMLCAWQMHPMFVSDPYRKASPSTG